MAFEIGRDDVRYRELRRRSRQYQQNQNAGGKTASYLATHMQDFASAVGLQFPLVDPPLAGFEIVQAPES